ncbi:unnamed protein product [Protopolystoma xenopodis]|uniref:Teneurin 1-4-like FN-plug domain-containing protein n=1 Tax=Protopolystoma xenopodis TaxID=117903 RepID=A0A448WCD9_9PLAT|nr:unnamed protein product [Protopolystoma xenopodis]
MLVLHVPANEFVNLGDFYLLDQQQFSKTQHIFNPELKYSEANLSIDTARLAASVTGFAPSGGLLVQSPIHSDLWVSDQYVFIKLLQSTSAVGGSLALPSSLVTPASSRDHFHIFKPPTVHKDSLSCPPDLHGLTVRDGPLVEDTNIRLVYRSSRVATYRSSLHIRILSPEFTVPLELTEIHLIVDVAGQRRTWRLEPDPGLEHTFFWNRLDGYNRTVYGVVNARGEL